MGLRVDVVPDPVGAGESEKSPWTAAAAAAASGSKPHCPCVPYWHTGCYYYLRVVVVVPALPEAPSA